MISIARTGLEPVRAAPAAPRHHVDLDQRALGQCRDTHTGACRPFANREPARIGGVHRRVVLLEARQVDAHLQHIRQREAAALQHRLQVPHHLVRLRLDAVRVGLVDRGAGERHLPGHVHPAVGFDRVAEGIGSGAPAIMWKMGVVGMSISTG